MSNKQSSVEWLFYKLWDTPKDKLNWYAIAEQAKAMHKEESISYVKDFAKQMLENKRFVNAEIIYNETYGGNNEL